MAKTAKTHEAVAPGQTDYVAKMYKLVKELHETRGLCGMKFFAVNRKGADDPGRQAFARVVCDALESSASGTGFV